MKKFIFIGDVHGRPEWKPIVDEALITFKEVIFLGDYVDSFNIRPVEIIHNLKEIIAYKKKHPDMITLLLGNHDYAYIDDHNGTSGFKWQMWQEYKKMFKDNIDLFQVAWGYTNPLTKKYTLATHAGLTKAYYNRHIKYMIKDPESILNRMTDGNAHELQLHEVFNYLRDDKHALWKVGPRRGGASTPGILWADYLELLEDRYEGINQIFGHTASGTVCVDQFGDDLVAKVDGHYNYQLTHLQINI